ncbi:MAG: hypothetical protein JNJ49_09460 [Bdellovibrionaceae bacterium]|nr:hypothetical protein [Pseudobdellovibrionaceae bacterium]
MNNSRWLIFAGMIVLAFWVGRISSREHVTPMTPSTSSEVQPVPVTSQSPEKTKPTDLQSPSTATTPHIEPTIAPVPTAFSSRREFLTLKKQYDATLENFAKHDAQFNTSAKIGDSDWNKVLAFKLIEGPVRFRFESGEVSKLKIRLSGTKMDAQFGVRYRTVTSSGTSVLRMISRTSDISNGDGIGLSRDGRAFHVVVDNPVEEGQWLDYSRFAVPVPLDWAGKREIETDVYGLNDRLFWETVGTAILTKRSAP